MSLKEEISARMKDAMKARDAATVGCLRLIAAAIKNREIEKRGELDDADMMKLLTQLAKQRNEAIEMYEKGGRTELAEKESRELAIIKSYLPEPLSDDELAKLVEGAIAEIDAQGPKDMGKVMKVIAPKTAGRADGRKVSEAVRAKLSGS